MLKIDEFRMEMEESKKIYSEELKRFAKRLNGTSKDIIKSTRKEIYNHMVNFSKANGIDEFSSNAYIHINR